MTIIVTGAGGMLGHAVLRAGARADVEVHGFTRAELDIADLASVTTATFRLPKPHTVINCAGIVRGRDDVDEPRQWVVNAVAPRALARRFDRLVQVSTDCVFDGQLYAGGESPTYNELTHVSPTDSYGRSKAHGEVSDGKHVTVRGSFIGFEGGLLRWFLDQPPNAVVDGYEDHVWTGGYVEDYADALLDIARSPAITGIVHLVGDHITKADLLHNVAHLLRPDIQVRPVLAPGGPRHMVLKSTSDVVGRLPDPETMVARIGFDASLVYGMSVTGI